MHDLILYSLHLHEYVRLRSLNLGPNCSIGLAEQGPDHQGAVGAAQVLEVGQTSGCGGQRHRDLRDTLV